MKEVTRPAAMARAAQTALAWTPYASMGGVELLAVNVLLGFEALQGPMLIAALLLALAAPLGLAAHLAVTSDLTPDEKRLWMGTLAGAHAHRAFARYFDVTRRARETKLLVRVERRRKARRLPDDGAEA